MDGWLELQCPYCQARFRIREAYAHLRGRCPACRFRIEAVRKQPYEPPRYTSTSEEPLGLVPLEDEWPEPAVLIPRDEVATYGLAGERQSTTSTTAPPTSTAPSVSPMAAEPRAAETAPPSSTPAPDLPPASTQHRPQYDILGEPIQYAEEFAAGARPGRASSPVASDQTPATPPAPAELAPASPGLAPPRQEPVIGVYQLADLPPASQAAGQRTAESDIAALSSSRAQADRPPPRPAEPGRSPPAEAPRKAKPTSPNLVDLFWTGVWDFPLRPRNLVKIAVGSLGFSLLWVFILLGAWGLQDRTAIGYFALCMSMALSLCVLVILGSYCSRLFFQIVQDTANGADDIEYGEISVLEGVKALAQMVWLLLIGAALPVYILSLVFDFLGIIIAFLTVPFWFCMIVLSTLRRGSVFAIVDPGVYAAIPQRWQVFLTMYLCVLGIALVEALTRWLVSVSVIFLPVHAVTSLVYLLLWARVLGRAGYALSQSPVSKKRRKRKRVKGDVQQQTGLPEVPGDDNSSTASNFVATPALPGKPELLHPPK